MKDNNLFQQTNQSYNTPVLFDEKPNLKPEIKHIEKRKIKIIDRKIVSEKSDSSKFSSAILPNQTKKHAKPEKFNKHSANVSEYSKTKPLSWFRKCLNFLFRIAKRMEKVKVFFGENAEQDPLYKLLNNSVQTTKYTPLNWFPKSLMIQFLKSANIYFLFITILTAMPFSPKMPETMFLTFAVVLFFTQLKEAYEDYRRYLQDNEVNFKKTLCYNFTEKEFMPKEWKNLEVGELVKVLKEEPFPADLIFLKSSEKNGISFVDTMNLDGETNLKEKIVFSETQNYENNNFREMKGFIECDSPNEFLELFDGLIHLDNQDNNNIPFPLSMKQMLLRGSILKNTAWIIGMTVYCGHQTKSYKNARKPRNKISNILKKMNQILNSLFALLGALSLIWTFAGISAQEFTLKNHNYLGQTFEVNFQFYIERFCTNVVAYSQIIPISLYVALEIVKLMHAYLIANDPDLFYLPANKKPSVKNSELIEELGQVEIIFSDKTGTLTSNIMLFKKCVINDVVFEEEFFKKFNKSSYQINLDSNADEILFKNEDFNSFNFDNFFRAMAICHTIVIDKDEKKPKLIKYQGSSPDELALVEGANRIGYHFLGRDSKKLKLQIFDSDPEFWEALVEFPFDSLRKRMSIIFKNEKTGKYILITKGADSVMFPRIKKEINIVPTEAKLNDFAREGLRTLVIAQKEMNEREFNEFWNEYQYLKVSSEKSKKRKLLNLYDLYEKHLDLVGVTGIEDKLQDGVPAAIYKLLEADIKIWVLTGDKQETAIEIGKSCHLIQPDMDLIILTSSDAIEVGQKILKKCEQYEINPNKPLKSLYKMENRILKNRKMCIVIDGFTLNFIMSDPGLKNCFFQLGIFANSCICCRVSPKQKADVIKLSKSYGSWVTLAIGDGANDVAMINEAHIGIGIYGKEGTQAARSADFAICQFRHLEKMLLVHGRWNYRRISLFISYYFYKNCTMVFTEIFFAFFNGFSGQIFFLDWLPMLFNAIWTSWPCIINSLLDQDVSAEISLQHPKLFKAGPCAFYFNFKQFWIWICFGFWHGICCFWLPVFLLFGSIDNTGDVESHWFISIISFSVMMEVITIKLFLETNYYSIANISFGIISVILYYFTISILNLYGVSKMLQPQMSGLFFHILHTPKCWLVLIATPFIALAPDYLFVIFKKIYFGTPADIIMKYNARKIQKINLKL